MSLITNPDQLNLFLNTLPIASDTETFFFILIARQKWNTTSSKIKGQIVLKRFVTNLKNAYEKISHLSEGPYFDGETVIPSETLGLYMLPNPRCLRKASFETIEELLRNVKNNVVMNPNTVSLTSLQTSCSRKVFFDLDIDVNSKEEIPAILQSISEKINSEAIHGIVETHGGCHLLIELSKIDRVFVKAWHPSISSIVGVTMNSDNVVPVPGCIQGGFSPRFFRSIKEMISSDFIERSK